MKTRLTVRTVRPGATLGWVLTGVAALQLLVAFPCAVTAQRSGLERVEELVRMGRAEEARGVLLRWWDDDRSEASRRELQRGLWLRGRLTVDPVQAELDFHRLVVLYPRGDYTADALFRLAQSAYEAGDDELVQEHLATLERDHRRSDALADAREWFDRAGPAPSPPEGRLREEVVVDAPPQDPEDDPPAEDPAEDDPPAEEPAPPEAEGTYFVQLGAFSEEERALALHAEVEAAGVDVRVVRVEGSGFWHVRFGQFVERADAVDELERLTEEGISAALVRDERPETLVRN